MLQAQGLRAEGLALVSKGKCMNNFERPERPSRSASGVSPLRFRTVFPVIRAAGLVPWSALFVVLFVVASAIVSVAEPGVGGFANAAWLMFQVTTTIGLGDFTCTSALGRICAVVLSIYSVLYLALITGAVVSYCSERMKARRDESVAHFIDQLEHLPELSPEELAALSEKVKKFDSRWR